MFFKQGESELCTKQHFKYVFVKIIRLSNGMKVNQVCSYMWYFYICSKQNKKILVFLVCKYSSFLLAQIAEGCFCSTSIRIPPLSVYYLLVKGLYQETWIHKGLNFKLLFKFLSFLNEVQKATVLCSRKVVYVLHKNIPSALSQMPTWVLAVNNTTDTCPDNIWVCWSKWMHSTASETIFFH